MTAASCLRDAQMCMPSFIAAVLDRGVRHLSFASALPQDVSRASILRRAGATLHEMRGPIAREFVRRMRLELAHESTLRAFDQRVDVDICLDDGLAAQLDLAHLCDAAELACTSERIEFEGLFCGARGELVVIDPNPLRPEVHAQNLAAALDALAVRRSVRAAWFTHLGLLLGVVLLLFFCLLLFLFCCLGVREAEFVPPFVGGRHFESWAAAA